MHAFASCIWLAASCSPHLPAGAHQQQVPAGHAGCAGGLHAVAGPHGHAQAVRHALLVQRDVAYVGDLFAPPWPL